MIKTNFPNEKDGGEQTIENSTVSSRAVQEQIGQIRRGKVMSFIKKAQEEGVGMFENATAGVANMWEGVRDHRRWLIDNGSTASFDTKISKLDTHAETIQEKMQREARRFDELAEKFQGGTMDLRDIERNKRAHLEEYEQRLEKIKQEREKIQAEKEAKEKEIQELKNRINDRITTGINKVKIETNFDYNLEQQGKLKEQIDLGTKSLAENKKVHAELTEKCKVMFGTGWKSVTRKALSTMSLGAIRSTRTEDNALDKLTDKQKSKLSPEEVAAYEKAQKGIEKDMEEKRMSFENLAVEIKAAMERHAVEIERLEANLAKLQAAKDQVDPLVIKGQSRIANWEAKRASYGIEHKIDGLKDDSKEVGEHILVKGFDKAKDGVDSVEKMIGSDLNEFEANIHSPEFLFGKGQSFNFKVSGFETVVQPSQISEALLTIRKETDSKIFDLENTVTKLKSTIDSGAVKKKEEVDDLKKQIDEIKIKIDYLKTTLLDKIPVDENGGIDEKIDQKALLLELCPDVNITSDDKQEVFGNKLETDDEKKTGLESLQAGIAEIDSIPDPVTRLKAYSKTIAFGLDNKLRLSLDQTAIDEIYNSIVNEKMPALFSQISDPKVAVEEGIGAIELLAEAGSSPVSSERMIQSVTEGICKNIENTTSVDEASASFLLFAEKFNSLDSSISSVAYPGRTVSHLLAVNLGEIVVKKIQGEDQDVYSTSKKSAELVSELDLRTNRTLNRGYIARLFVESLDYLEKNSDFIDVESKKREDESIEVKNLANHTNPKFNEYPDALKYIKDKMSQAGFAHGEKEETAKTSKEISDQIDALNQVRDLYGLAEYAALLATENHPDESMKAIDFALVHCQNNFRKLKAVGDIFAEVDGEFYRNKTKEIYDSSLKSVKEAHVSDPYFCLDLIDSLHGIESGEQVDDAVEYTSSLIVSICSRNIPSGLRSLDAFLEKAEYLSATASGTKMQESALKISEDILKNISNSNSTEIVACISLLEKHDLGHVAFETFKNQVDDMSLQEAFSCIKYFGNQDPTQVYGLNPLEDIAKDKYVDKIIKKIVEGSTMVVSDGVEEATFVEVTPKVKNIVILYKELAINGFAENAKDLFENNINLENQQSVVELADLLRAGKVTNPEIEALSDNYAKKAIEMSEGDLEGLTNLMTHWADLNNNMYTEALAKVRKLANGDYTKLMNLAEIMDKHEIDLSLQITLEEAEQIAKQNLESRGFEVDTGFSELENVAAMYEKIKGLDGEGRRLRAEIEKMKNEPMDESSLDEQVFVNGGVGDADFAGMGDLDFTGRSTEGVFPGSAGREDRNSGTSANNSKKKKGGFFSNLFSGFFSLGNDKK